MDELTKNERRTVERVATMNIKRRKTILYVLITVVWLLFLTQAILNILEGKFPIRLWSLGFLCIITAFAFSNLYWVS